jgi:hypothetical protein
MNKIDKLFVDGQTYWRVSSIHEPSKPYERLLFVPVLWGMYIAFFSVALWLALDLIFQVHITFRRWSGMYYWTVLGTSIGVGLHATMLTVKMFTVQNVAENIGTTILTKMGDIFTQTGFSLVLYSRLNLVMRAQQAYLKYILILILVSSLAVHTSTTTLTIGMNTRKKPEWFKHALFAEQFLIVWYTLLEFSLSTLYTYNTAQMTKDSAVLLKHQSKKTRQNLLRFMVFAQVVTSSFDITLVVLLMMRLKYKQIFMPFFYGIKLKVEFMALNQLQSLVQPNVNMFVFTGDSSPNQPRQPVERHRDIELAGLENLVPADEEHGSQHPQLESTKNDAAMPASEVMATGNGAASRVGRASVVQISHVSSTGSITELERQYLGRNSK